MMTGLVHGQKVAYRGGLWIVWAQSDRRLQWLIGKSSPAGISGIIEASQHFFYPPTLDGLTKSREYADKRDGQPVSS